MTVLGLANLQPKPGRTTDAYAETMKVVRIARDVMPDSSLWRTMFGGDDTFRLTVATETDSFAAHFEADRVFYALPELRAVLDRHDETSFPHLNSAATSLFMTVPGREQPPVGPSTAGRPRAAISALYAPSPAVFEHLDTVAQRGDRLGFVSRQYQSIAAGARPPVVLVAQLFADRAAMGSALDAMANDAAIVAGLQATGSSLLGRWLLEEIPL